jgi:hypothetical protein
VEHIAKRRVPVCESETFRFYQNIADHLPGKEKLIITPGLPAGQSISWT